jgi:hypothetical protein
MAITTMPTTRISAFAFPTNGAPLKSICVAPGQTTDKAREQV